MAGCNEGGGAQIRAEAGWAASVYSAPERPGNHKQAMTEEGYKETPPARKSPGSTYARGKPPRGSPESAARAVAQILSRLAQLSLELPVSAFSGSEQIEITATDERSGVLLDRACTTLLPALKKFIRRNRQRGFSLHVWAGAKIAHLICASLGMPFLYDSGHSGGWLRIREQVAMEFRREIITLAEGDTYAWRGVTVHFPRDPWQRATVRDALLLLTVRPAAAHKVKARPLGETAKQLSLAF